MPLFFRSKGLLILISLGFFACKARNFSDENSSAATRPGERPLSAADRVLGDPTDFGNQNYEQVRGTNNVSTPQAQVAVVGELFVRYLRDRGLNTTLLGGRGDPIELSMGPDAKMGTLNSRLMLTSGQNSASFSPRVQFDFSVPANYPRGIILELFSRLVADADRVLVENHQSYSQLIPQDLATRCEPIANLRAGAAFAQEATIKTGGLPTEGWQTSGELGGAYRFLGENSRIAAAVEDAYREIASGSGRGPRLNENEKAAEFARRLGELKNFPEITPVQERALGRMIEILGRRR